jgi:hypothetical protein
MTLTVNGKTIFKGVEEIQSVNVKLTLAIGHGNTLGSGIRKERLEVSDSLLKYK